jgi:FSR family fosmidomycin resistance protein-like MFS transporter
VSEEEIQMKYKSIGLFVLAHAATDLNQGAIPILLPYFITAHHVNYTAVAMIVFVTNLISTVMQPVFGYIADRKPLPWLIPSAMIMAGIGVSLSGLAPTFDIALVSVALSGLGFAAFHPEGAKLINRLAGAKKATGMSFFSVGGQLGFAVGPIFATAVLVPWGLKGTLCFGVPALIMAAVMVQALPGLSIVDHKQLHVPDTLRKGHDAWVPFSFLAAAMLCRSVVFYGLNTFLPLYLIDVLHQSKTAAGSSLTVLVVASIIGNLFGGRLADRFGYRLIIIAGFILLSCFLPLLLIAPTVSWFVILFAPIGLVLSLPVSPMVVLGQSYLPNHVGLASGVTLGLALSFGGIMTPFLGMIADHHGLYTTILILTILPLICMCLSLALKSQKDIEAAQINP